MAADESVTAWLAALKSGRRNAAEPIWQRYVVSLATLARRKLKNMPRRAADEEDVVLSAFEGFLKGVDDGRFTRLDDRDDLWQILVMLTERRAIALHKRESSLKRGGGQIRGESVFANSGVVASERGGLDQQAGREASPAFAAEATAELTHLLGLLGDPQQRQIAIGRLHGKTNEELATELGVSLRTIERKLAIIRTKWQDKIDHE